MCSIREAPARAILSDRIVLSQTLVESCTSQLEETPTDGLTYLPVLFFSSTLADESNYLTDSRLIPFLLGCSHVIANRRGITLPRRQEQIALQTMLLGVELEVASMQRIEFFMSAPFDNLSLLDHQDLISAPNRSGER